MRLQYAASSLSSVELAGFTRDKMALHQFSVWLDKTSLSGVIQNTAWIIPTVQSVHIVAIAALFSSTLLLDLRLAGLIGRNEAVSRFSGRYLPWVWWSLLALLGSGLVLVIGEPSRSLENATFLIKMALVSFVALLTLTIQWPMLKDDLYWEPGDRRLWVRTLAWASLAIWIAIIVCGRLIAYTTG